MGALFASLMVSSFGVQSRTLPFEEYSKRITSASTVSPLTMELFGEQISLYNGSTEFSATDIEIPGNNKLGVGLSRSLRIESLAEFTQKFGGFGSWDLDVPYIKGSYLDNWGSFSAPSGRCSWFAPPPDWGEIKTKDYWSGAKLHLPGQGDQDILRIDNHGGLFPKMQAPSDGYTYRLGTKDFHRIRCKATTANGFPGEGFIVVTTDGTTMTFDVGITRNGGTIGKPVSYGNYADADRTDVYLLVSSIVDRHGNSVNYNWNGGKLQSITSSDGRSISLTWSGSVITSATANGRTWTYEYNAGTLSRVGLPDGSAWAYNTLNAPGRITSPFWAGIDASDPGCTEPPEGAASGWITMTHPSGAQGRFDFQAMRHRRTGVPTHSCYLVYSDPEGIQFSRYELATPDYFDVLSLTSKQITGPGVPSMTWSYSYEIANEGRVEMAMSQPLPCTTCQADKKVRVTGPDGAIMEYRFGTLYEGNDGLLLGTNRRDGSEAIVRSEQNVYMTPAEAQSMPFPEVYGYNLAADDGSTSKIRPIKTTTITQDGATFNSQTNSFDSFARTLSVDKWSGGMVTNFGRTDVTEYSDNLGKWVLGQVRKVTNANTNVVMEQTDYDPVTALPLRSYGPGTTTLQGKLQQTLTYNADGTVATVKDGNNNVTTLTNWYRGIPRNIQYADSTTNSAAVNDNGWITATTDENGFSTGYGYDAMGRLASIVYPTDDSTLWNNTTISFYQAQTNEHGLAPGHWTRAQRLGNRHVNTYYDAMWRPVVEEQLDYSNVAGTLSQTVKRYDVSGRLAFQSYPTTNVGDFNSITQGARTSYDALDRVTRVEQDSELGVLASTTVYQSGFQTLSTNPRGLQVTTEYQTYDRPTTDFPVGVTTSADTATEIHRDVFGKPTLLVRRNHANTQRVDRRYVYDDYQQLCKTIEPETGATVMDYDGAGNLQWSAAGTGLISTSGCDTIAGRDSGRKVTRLYDARNRMNQFLFPDGRGNQLWTYTSDGLPDTITTWNGLNGDGPVINRYDYNKRRMLKSEAVEQPTWYAWGISYGYDANGSLATQTYPTNFSVNYAPNALGQATQAGSYATGVQYYPNGAIKQFTYGNGIVHTMQQNARQLPNRSTDSGGAHDLGYSYDANANVNYIANYAQDTGDGFYGRWMVYDGLDRLTDAGSCTFGGDCWHRFTYDALDNMKSWKLPGVKDYAEYVYGAKNQLANIKNTAGATVVGLSYDEQGNLENKNGKIYDFDYGNRLKSTDEEWYRYDGHGRRVLNWRWNEPGVLSQYSQSGQLMYDENYRASGRKSSTYIYLAGSLVATNEWNFDIGTGATKYQHTDALGSPVAVTNAAGTVIDRINYEPYGAAINKTVDGIGYTGHVMDSATGLTYMQQRYYDPGIGRFLSVDPITADGDTGSNFNRYKYAANNPYRFIDPDGRQEKTCTGSRVSCPSATQGAPQNEPVARTSGKSGSRIESSGKASQTTASTSPSTAQPLYCGGGADCDFMYNQSEFLSGNISSDEFSDRTVTQGIGGATGAIVAVGTVAALEGGGFLWASTAAGIRYAWKNVRVDGPSAGLAYANGRVVGISWRGSNLNVRLDYAPIPGSKGTPVLHINFGKSGRGQAPHIVIWDPRWYTPNTLK